jgi:hypothetical protein
MSLRTNMTGSSNSKDDESRQPDRDATASSTTPYEPLQFEHLERLTGDRWIKETPCESKPSRDFILPPAVDSATDARQTDKSRTAKSGSAALSKSESGND